MKLPTYIRLKKNSKVNPYYVIRPYENKKYTLGFFPTLEEAQQALQEFDDDPESYIKMLAKKRKRNLPDGVQYKKGKKNPYRVEKMYKKKRYSLGFFSTIADAAQASRDFDEDPEEFIQFLEFNQSRELPKNITIKKEKRKKSYYVRKIHNGTDCFIGYFQTIEDAEHALAKFNADPDKWVKEYEENKRKLPKNILFIEHCVNNPYNVTKMYNGGRYCIGFFASLREAEQALKEFNDDPEQWIENYKWTQFQSKRDKQ